MRRAWIVAPALALACLPRSFDALEQGAPVETIAVGFSADPDALIQWAATVQPDDEGRGRVLFSDGEAWIGWLRIDESGAHELEFIVPFVRESLTGVADPTFTGLAVAADGPIPEGLVRLAGDASGPDRIVRFRVADFSSSADPVVVPAWVVSEHPDAVVLAGPLGAVQLDAGLAELFSAAQDGSLLVWPELGTNLAEIEGARAEVLAEDPSAFDDDPALGFGITRCPDISGVAPMIVGGAFLASERRAAVVADGAGLTFVALADPPQTSLVGTPVLDCAAESIELPESAAALHAGDIDADGDDDLLVGLPVEERVLVFLGEDDLGLGLSPAIELAPEQAREGGFGSSLAAADLGGDVGRVLVVGAPQTKVGSTAKAGRVHVFDLEGVQLTEFSDLEPRTDASHGLGVHALGLPGRDELVVSGHDELRIHWALFDGDPRP